MGDGYVFSCACLSVCLFTGGLYCMINESKQEEGPVILVGSVR